MKTKIFYAALMFIAVVFFSCKKEKEESNGLQEVTFQADQIAPGGGLKSSDAFEVNCSDIEPTNAHITIGTEAYDPQVFRIDGKLFTQAIKLVPGNYSVSTFLLYKESGAHSGYQSTEDVTVMATPAQGSPYAVYTEPKLNFNFTVAKFAKTEVKIEVLCFEAAKYSEFGFGWFAVGEIVLREQCFFGDFCMKHPADYAGSSYASQAGGLKLDMPAIFKIMAYKNGVLVPNNDNFTNNTAAAGWGVGSPVCVQYPDNLNIKDELFEFELWILVKVGTAFQYKLFHTWTFKDAEKITAGTDGVVDFVLGSCNISNTDLQLAPYQNLPANCTLKVDASPGPLSTYIGVTLSGIGAGFDILNGAAGAYCADQGHFINLGQTYAMGVHSSLYPGTIPAGYMEPQALANLDQANWLMNHLGDYTGETMQDIQQALWKILDAQANLPYSNWTYTPLAIKMAADAAANGNNYVPLPGGWAAVVFAVSGDVQIIFTVVDP